MDDIETRRHAEMAAYDALQDDCDTRQQRRWVWLTVVSALALVWTVAWVVVS